MSQTGPPGSSGYSLSPTLVTEKADPYADDIGNAKTSQSAPSKTVLLLLSPSPDFVSYSVIRSTESAQAVTMTLPSCHQYYGGWMDY